jgi:hypothetical protein
MHNKDLLLIEGVAIWSSERVKKRLCARKRIGECTVGLLSSILFPISCDTNAAGIECVVRDDEVWISIETVEEQGRVVLKLHLRTVRMTSLSLISWSRRPFDVVSEYLLIF